MAAALFFGQYVNFAFKFAVRFDGAGFADDLAAFDVVAFGAAQEEADVVASAAFVEQFAEHFDAGDDGFLGVANADDFDFFANFDDATLNSAGDDGAAAGDGEDDFYWHQERLVDGALR